MKAFSSCPRKGLPLHSACNHGTIYLSSHAIQDALSHFSVAGSRTRRASQFCFLQVHSPGSCLEVSLSLHFSLTKLPGSLCSRSFTWSSLFFLLPPSSARPYSPKSLGKQDNDETNLGETKHPSVCQRRPERMYAITLNSF